MKKLWILMLALMVLVMSFVASAESPTNLSEYSTEFNWKALFRRPEEHIGEKYILQGSLYYPNYQRTEEGGYDGLFFDIGEYASLEYMLLWIEPLEFNLFNGDWVEVHVTITDVGPLREAAKNHEVFYAHVDALTVYDERGGNIIETYMQTDNADVGIEAG